MCPKKIIVLFFLILFFAPICFPQEDLRIDSSKEDYNQAIQFYIINQVIAAYKYHFSENSAIRFTINASGLFTDDDTDNREYREWTTDTVVYYSNSHTANSNQFFEFKFQYLHHIKV